MRLFGKGRRPRAAPGTTAAPRGEGEAGPPAPPPVPPPEGVRLAEHIGHLWREIEAIAREDGLKERSAVEHFNASAEGKKDVERWLNIYWKRVRPGHDYRLPAHHPRHRGYCLVARLWPEGLRWQAIHEETLFRAPVPEAPDRESLIALLDRHLGP